MSRAIVLALTLAHSALALAAPASHLEEHRELMLKFQELRERDPRQAETFAREKLEQAAQFKRFDQRRGHALELMAQVLIAQQAYDRALVVTTDLVQIRNKAKPVEHELRAHALGLHALALFATNRAGAADEMLRAQLEAWEKAFGPDDLRLALKLENQVEYVQKGFGRTRWAIELLQRAAKIREAHPEVGRGRLAATLQELALQQMAISEYREADRALEKAQAFLETESAPDPEQEEENKAGLAQILVLRCGLAGLFAQREQAMAYAERAKNITLQNRILKAETDILVAAGLSAAFEVMDDFETALGEEERALDVFENNQDLTKEGLLDINILSDVVMSLARLYLALNDLPLARQALELVQKQTGETSQLHFQLAELEAKSGNEEGALTHYQSALRLRKESGSEMAIFFGTNRRLKGERERADFGPEAAGHVSLGTAAVLVPGGQFSDESWVKSSLPIPLPVGRATDPRPLVIRRKEVLEPAPFQQLVRQQCAAARLYRDAALVFVHGYNVEFDDALKRGAQLVRDLNFDGPALVFSWPSRGDWWKYGADRASADSAAKSLAGFLDDVGKATGVKKIHVIAHSMGNRVLLPALAEVLKFETPPKLGEIILAAPAVRQSEFREHMKPLRGSDGLRFTLYASAADKALKGGFFREWGNVLAGYVTGGKPLLHPQVDSIDLSEAGEIGLMNLNHDVFASNPVMTEDMRQLLQKGQRPPHKRLKLLQPRPKETPEFWYYTAPPVD